MELAAAIETASRRPDLCGQVCDLSARTVEMAVLPEQLTENARLWDEILVSVRGRLRSHQAFETWFKPIVPLSLTPEPPHLELPNASSLDCIHDHPPPS